MILKSYNYTELDYFNLIEKTQRQIKRFIQQELSKRDINISQEHYSVLKEVYNSPGISQSGISNSISRDPASVTRMLDLLEKNEFIIRNNAGNDRRSYAIHLTQRGENLVQSVFPLIEKMNVFGLNNIPEKDFITFIDVLNRINFNLE